MPTRKFQINRPRPEDDAAVAWARRNETIRGALKLFRVLFDAVRRHAEWAEVRHGVSGAQLWGLCELHQSPGMRAVDLAKIMAVHRHSAETILRELERQDLVRSVLSDATHSATYFLTTAGQSIADAVPEYGQGVLKAALDQLPDATLEQVVAALRAINESLPFREDRAALKPMADILRPAQPATKPRPHEQPATLLVYDDLEK